MKDLHFQDGEKYRLDVRSDLIEWFATLRDADTNDWLVVFDACKARENKGRGQVVEKLRNDLSKYVNRYVRFFQYFLDHSLVISSTTFFAFFRFSSSTFFAFRIVEIFHFCHFHFQDSGNRFRILQNAGIVACIGGSGFGIIRLLGSVIRGFIEDATRCVLHVGLVLY